MSEKEGKRINIELWALLMWLIFQCYEDNWDTTYTLWHCREKE
jgi:hypothetical protein